MTVEKTVLIADDSKDMLAALSHRCKAMGLNVVPAVDGSRGLKWRYCVGKRPFP